jgi:hypothetical protein
MARQDYIPAADGDFLMWLQTFRRQVAALASQFDLTQPELDAITADLNALQASLATLNTKKAEMQAAAADKAETRRQVVGRMRALSNRLKAHRAYSDVQGRQLGIIGPEDSTDLSTARPTLRVAMVQPGQVSITFNKSTSTGVTILGQRGPETTFSFLAIDTVSPYVDTRPNLAPGPETRYYQARYLDGDDPVGLLSDTVIVTVPG